MQRVTSEINIANRYFLCKQKSAYELRISDWSSDVCSSDLAMKRAFPHTVQSHETVAFMEGDRVRLGIGNDTDVGKIPLWTRRNKTSELGNESCRERVCQ